MPSMIRSERDTGKRSVSFLSLRDTRKAICEFPELKGYGESELRAALSGGVSENVICEILSGWDTGKRSVSD